jgi:hypothetical protein
MCGCFSFYSGLYNGPERAQYQGDQQGDIMHVPRIRPIAPLFMANVVCIVFFTLGLLVSLISNLANLGIYEPM